MIIMKKTIPIFLTVISVVCFSTIKAQNSVGIDTANPLGIFHVDGKKNTAASSPTDAQLSDDFIINASTGTIGIGVLLPKTKLDLRNGMNTDNAIGIGNTTLTAAQAEKGALRYNGTILQYSNGTEWVNITPVPAIKTVVAATKTTQPVYCYAAGGVSVGNYNGIPHRTPCYITDWNQKYNNSTVGGTFAPSSGVFTANRNGVFTATFTFALASGKVRAFSADANQVEAIWRLRDSLGNELNSVKCANNYPSDSRSTDTGRGSVPVGSSCTASFYMTAGQTIRPEVWIDLDPDLAASKNFNVTAGSSGVSYYNNLTITEQ